MDTLIYGPELVEVSRMGSISEPYQTLFARGAYTASDSAPAQKWGLVMQH